MKANVQQTTHNKNKKDNRRTPSPKSSGRKNASSPSEVCFSSSAFLNSPDPSSLPIPMFDDECDVVLNDKVVHSQKSTNSLPNKTDTLRQFLNIRQAISV